MLSYVGEKFGYLFTERGGRRPDHRLHVDDEMQKSHQGLSPNILRSCYIMMCLSVDLVLI